MQKTGWPAIRFILFQCRMWLCIAGLSVQEPDSVELSRNENSEEQAFANDRTPQRHLLLNTMHSDLSSSRFFLRVA
jgi:hypothetical protein